MATTRTDDRNEALDPEAIDRLFASVGQASRDVPSRASQPTIVAAPKLGRPLPSRDSSRPTPCRLPQAEYADKVRLWRDWLPTVWLVGCLLVAGFCFLMGMPNSPLRKTTVGAAVAKYVEQPRLRTRDIQDFDVGRRSAGTNPLRHQVETAPEPDPETSRKLVLRMKKESGLRLDARLLRSVDWIEAVGAKECGTFFLDLPEMGAVGDAYVEAILPCPPIEDGPGNVVTGVFAHEADGVTRSCAPRGDTDSDWADHENNLIRPNGRLITAVDCKRRALGYHCVMAFDSFGRHSWTFQELVVDSRTANVRFRDNSREYFDSVTGTVMNPLDPFPNSEDLDGPKSRRANR